MGVQVINQIMPTHKKHHFIPRFYFDRWKGADQKITYYSWLNDQLHIGSAVWQCRYKVDNKWIRATTKETQLDLAVNWV